MRRFPPVLVAATVAAVAGCGDGLLEPGRDTGPLTASINGESFVADSVRVNRLLTAIQVVAVGTGGRSVNFQFPRDGARAYVISAERSANIGAGNGPVGWIAQGDQGTGVITITVLSDTRIEGSLSCTCVGGAGPPTAEVRARFAIDG